MFLIKGIPVFVKESGIILLQSSIEPSDTLFLHFYNGNSYNSFIYYEDDGCSYEYLERQYYKREIVNDPLSRKIVLFKANGTLSSKYSKLVFFFHDFDIIKKIKLNSSKIYFISEDNLIRFCIDNSDSEILIEY